MFYPFTATMAQKTTREAKLSREAEDEVLLQAYLTIAHCYINRAASRGNTRCYSYCPFNLRNEFIDSLYDAGFTCVPIVHSNMVSISWGES